MVWTSLIAQGKRRQWMSLFVATLVALVFLHLARFYQGQVSTWVLVAFSVPVIANLLRAGLGLAYRLDRHPFRVLDLGLVTDQVAPGQSLQVEILLEARRGAKLARLSAELRAARYKTTEKGKEVTVYHRDAKSLEEGLVLEPGLRRRFQTSFELPPGAPFSFRSMEAKIVWMVRVEAAVESWGEIRDEIEVTVAPG